MSSSTKKLNLNWLGLVILAACYLTALINVVQQKSLEQSHDVIRLAHWQLELGVRDGLDQLIKQFEEKKAEEGRPVKIMQIPIPGQVYQQYAITQLVGGSPPDMLQIGKFPEPYLERYFSPLSQDINKPNPFLAERWNQLHAQASRSDDEEALFALLTELKDLPWSDSFTDGLRSMFREQSQEYYGVGFSQFTIRLFYNKTLFRQALGNDQVPATYGDLVEACKKLEAWANETNRKLTPIASSRFQLNLFKTRYIRAMTADVGFAHDLDRNGFFSPEERLLAMIDGHVGPWNEEYKAANTLLLSLADYFQPGFMGMENMDATFSFIQQQSAMIMTGSWDAHSLLKKVEEQPESQRFEIGVFDIPAVSADHPEYGKHFDGRVTESTTGTQFPLAITRRSPHRELCIEFLQFCTTPENNSLLNKRAQWIPSVRGAEMHDFLLPFMPNFTGYGINTMMETTRFGSQVNLVESQVFWPFIQGEVSYEDYSERVRQGMDAAIHDDATRLFRAPANILTEIHARRSALLSELVFDDPPATSSPAYKLMRSSIGLATQSRLPARMQRLIEDLDAEETKPGRPVSPELINELKQEFGHHDS
jgi:raffinose/stachyose/melibiose transport system substrate-binding protein